MKMLPLIDGAGYKLFDSKMLSLTDGARNKLFGTKMLPHLPLRRWGSFMEEHMLIAEGYFYHISDSFFSEVQESTMMSNYEGGGYRPHYLAIRDLENPQVFWMVPVSSQYAKFSALHRKMTEKYGRCTKIVLGKCGGKDAAFLIQNAFPITADYFDHIHTLQEKPLTLHQTTAKTVISNLHNNLRLHKKGVRLFFADIDRIYTMMLEHLSSLNEENKPELQTDLPKEEIDSRLQEGLNDIQAGRVISADDVEAEMRTPAQGDKP